MKLGGAEDVQERGPSRGFKAFWEKLGSRGQRTTVLVGFVLLVVVLSLVGYKVRSKPLPQAQGPGEKETKLVGTDSQLFERAFTARMESLEAYVKELSQRYSVEGPGPQAEKELSPAETTREVAEPESSPPAAPSREKTEAGASMPPLPFSCTEPGCKGDQLPVLPPPPGAAGEGQQLQAAPKVSVVGDIAVVSARQEKAAEEKKTEGEEQGVRMKVYLPPSFMEATLLSGITAPATSEGKANPIPVLLRIRDLAVLPNSVKADLKGCFVIGEAAGSLADERAHVRLTTLSCVARNGRAVIDQAVKGFVVDEDGKVGLKGRVVSKLGAVVARAALAGLFGGIGEGVSLTAYNFQTTAEGTAQFLSQTDLENIARAGLGRGIAQATQELQKFYMELARQTLPVVEVGATKKVTVVISEGVELRVRDHQIFTTEKAQEAEG